MQTTDSEPRWSRRTLQRALAVAAAGLACGCISFDVKRGQLNGGPTEENLFEAIRVYCDEHWPANASSGTLYCPGAFLAIGVHRSVATHARAEPVDIMAVGLLPKGKQLGGAILSHPTEDGSSTMIFFNWWDARGAWMAVPVPDPARDPDYLLRVFGKAAEDSESKPARKSGEEPAK